VTAGRVTVSDASSAHVEPPRELRSTGPYPVPSALPHDSAKHEGPHHQDGYCVDAHQADNPMHWMMAPIGQGVSDMDGDRKRGDEGDSGHDGHTIRSAWRVSDDSIPIRIRGCRHSRNVATLDVSPTDLILCPTNGWRWPNDSSIVLGFRRHLSSVSLPEADQAKSGRTCCA